MNSFTKGLRQKMEFYRYWIHSILVLALVGFFNVGFSQSVYTEDFGTSASVALPYSFGTNATGSASKNANLTTPSWTQTVSTGNFGGSSGGAMSGTGASNTVTCTFNVNSGFKLTPASIAYNYRISGTGPTALNISISGTGGSTSVAAITTNRSGAFVGVTTSAFSSTAQNLTGAITLTFTFTGGAGTGTMRLDDVTLNGAVASTTPTISPTSNSFTAFTTTYGAVSTAQTVAVTGTNLTANITATASTGFEVSNGGAYGASTSFTQSGGSASGTLSVRLKANAAVSASYDGITAVSLTSTGATTRNYTTAATGNTVTARNLTITGVTVADKTYSGTAAAVLGGTPSYVGLQNSETFSVTGTPTANFNNATVGNIKPVTVLGYTAPSSNYTVSQPVGLTANINPAALTITGIAANNKPFDGNTTATLSGTPSYVGLQNSETFTVTGTPSANFNTAAVGNNKPVTVTGYTAPTSNYTVSQPTGLTANISGNSEATADFRSKQDGDFSSATTWEFDLGGGNYTNATAAPTSTNKVSIAHTVVLNQDFTVGASKNFTLGTGAIFTINPARVFAIAGAADFGGKAVTIQSGNTGTGSIGQVTGTLTGATNVTVERYIPSNGFRSWRLLSVPVATSQTIRQAWQEGDANPNPKDNNLLNRGTQITGVFTTQAAAAAAGFDSTSVQAAMLRWNTSAWANITITNQPLNNYSSYFLYIRGDRSQTVTGAVSNSSATTLRERGTVYTGDQATSVGASEFALVPNLYPSAINFTGLTRTGGVNALFYIWDSKKLNGNSLGMYQTFSATSSYNCLISGGSYVLGQPNTTIESGQSFFVTSGAAGTIVLKESAKISGTNGSLGFRPLAKSKIDTRLYNSNDEMLDANAVVFDAAYDKAVAEEDAPKMGNPGANFAIETGNKILAIEGTEPVKENDAIQFRMWNIDNGNYTVEFAASNLNLPEGVAATLEDSYLGTSTIINLSKAIKVRFTVNQDAVSSAANRFRLVFAKTKTVITAGNPTFTIAPNPIENGAMNLQFKNQPGGRYAITLVNNSGQTILTRVVNHVGGNSTEVLKLPSNISAGVYKVVIISPENSKVTQPVLINNK